MRELAKKIAAGYQHRDDVTGIFVGGKSKEGKPTDEICAVIGVRRKLSDGMIIPGHSIPKEIYGLKTDVVQMNPKPAGNTTDSFGVMQGGVAMGPEDTPNTKGTAGLICYDASDYYNVGFLTCAHVAVVKEDYSRYILQPSRDDIANITIYDRVGTLTRYLVDSRNDSAIVRILYRDHAFEMFPTNEIITSVEDPTYNEIYEMCGAATGVTTHDVRAFGQFKVDLGSLLGGEIWIDGFSLLPFGGGGVHGGRSAEEGDSGAILYKPGTGIGVGMLVAIDAYYSPGYDEETFAAYLSYVMEDMNLILSYDSETTYYWSEVIAEKQEYWIKIGDEMVTSFTISPSNDIYHTYLFTESAFADGVNGVMWGKRSTDSTYSLIGPNSLSPSCFIGDISSGESVTIDLKLLPTSMLSELTSYQIPVYVGHGSTLTGGYI